MVDYVAPEMLTSETYGQETDLWSLGAILFECLIGYPPFCSKSKTITCHKIAGGPTYIPSTDFMNLGVDARDLIQL